MFGVSIGVRPRVLAALTEAQAFIQRVTTAGGILTTTEQQAVTELVAELKTYGIWTKMKAIYPMVGAPKNLFSYTTDFSNAYWVGQNVNITLNATTAPDGSNTAIKLEKTAGEFVVSRVFTGDNPWKQDNIVTMSCYVKNSTAVLAELRLDAAGNTCNAQFNFSTNSMTGGGGRYLSSSSTFVGDGWYRISVTGTMLGFQTPDYALHYGGSVGSSYFIWGMQVELGGSMTSLLPIVGSRNSMAAAACAQNLVGPSYTGSFTSGWGYLPSGIVGNGTSTSMSTGFTPSTSLTLSSGHISIYSRTDVQAEDCDFGNDSASSGALVAPEQHILSRYTGLGTVFTYGTYTGGAGGSNSTGLFITNRNSSTNTTGFRNLTKMLDIAQTSGLGTQPLTVGAQSGKTRFTSRQYAFASIGDGFTDTEANNFYRAVQKFQGKLNRSVGVPIVSDTDAQDYVFRVYTAGGTLTTTELNAVNQFTIDLKAAGVWTKMHAIYPMLGSSAAACAQNLKSSSFTATFTSVGWTFASTGVKGNGSSAYMDTGFTPSSHFASFNNGASFYSRTTGVANSYEYGVQATGGIGHNVYVNYSTFGARWHLQCTFADRPLYSPTAGEGSGLYVGVTGASNDRRFYKNGSLVASNTNTSGVAISSLAQSIPLGCLRDSTNGYQMFSAREFSLFALHENLTAGEVTSYTNANSTFQTTLSRNV
jgi:hypothetical protein